MGERDLWGGEPPAWAAEGEAAVLAVAAGYRHGGPGVRRGTPPLLYVPLSVLERSGHSAETVGRLRDAGLLDLWRPTNKGDAASLSPLAMHRLGLRLDEEWHLVQGKEEWREFDRRKGKVVLRVRRPNLLSEWDVIADAAKPIPRPHQPREERCCGVADWFWASYPGEDDPVAEAIVREEVRRAADGGLRVLDTDGQEVRLFAGNGTGVPVVVDRRLG